MIYRGLQDTVSDGEEDPERKTSTFEVCKSISTLMDELPADYVPELRLHPPWLMEEMVEAEPDLVQPILRQTGPAAAIAEHIRTAWASGHPITVSGCGTSETAAIAIAGLLNDSLPSGSSGHAAVIPRQAFEAALEPWPEGYFLGISHEGGTRATMLAMDAARRVGARVGLITARSKSPGVSHADDVFVTPRIDRSWCHTVGYVSPMLAGAAIAEANAPGGIDPAALESALKMLLAVRPAAQAVAHRLAGADRVVVLGAGPDRSPAMELALKIEEGARLPARMLELETLLHGHLAACDEKTGLILIAAGAADRAVKRAALALSAARLVGVSVAAILSPAAASALEPPSINAGSILFPAALESLGLIGRLTGAALCLQLLTLELAAVRGTNPDLIRREDRRYREAAAVAENDTSW